MYAQHLKALALAEVDNLPVQIIKHAIIKTKANIASVLQEDDVRWKHFHMQEIEGAIALINRTLDGILAYEQVGQYVYDSIDPEGE